MGGVQWDERHVPEPGPEDDLRGLGIGPDVEFGGGRGVARLVRAAHHDHPRDALDDPRLASYREGDVGEWADRHQDDLVGGRQVRLDEELHRIAAPA